MYGRAAPLWRMFLLTVRWSRPTGARRSLGKIGDISKAIFALVQFEHKMIS